MIREHDERAKLIAELTLDALGEVQREVEIPTADPPRMDLWFRRLYIGQAVPCYLQLMNQLFYQDCIVEIFSRAVGLRSFFECIKKQYLWRSYLEQELWKKTQHKPLVLPPMLWVLCTGHPDEVLARYRFTPRPGPSGIYLMEPGASLGLVVIGELPSGAGRQCVKETLLLRMLGATTVQSAALRELELLPKDDPELPRLRRIVASLRRTLSHAKNITQEEREEFMTAAMREFEEYEEQLRRAGYQNGRLEGFNDGRLEGFNDGRLEGFNDGRLDGRLEGLRAAILKACTIYQLEPTQAQLQLLHQLDPQSLEQLFEFLLAHRAWPQTWPQKPV